MTGPASVRQASIANRSRGIQRLIIAEHALPPCVGERNDRGQQEEQDPPEKEQAKITVRVEIVEDDGPRVEEDDLDVEQEKRHGHDVEPDVEAAAGRAERIDTGFVGHALDAALPGRSQDRAEHDVTDREHHRHQHEQTDGAVMAETTVAQKCRHG